MIHHSPCTQTVPVRFRPRGIWRRSPVTLCLGLALLSCIPCLTGCHREIEGENIDLPPERPGRFIPEAAPAEARRSKEAQDREDLAAANGQKPPAPSNHPEDRFEALMPSNATSGPLESGDGHMVIPQAQPIYGKTPQTNTPQSPH
ncbi:MAG: hypothetical protein ACTIDN_03740 [Acetobacter sp.]|uniref:hypothetical protein n=1 Tax=Acetobacter sp. TaxID=440 RepID=UPI003F8E12B8